MFKQIETIAVSVETLVPYEKNAKIHSEKQVRQIADSILNFGFNVPVLIDENNMILAGHGRVLAAQLLGMKEVPTNRIIHLSEREKKAFILTDNRVGENASWDYRLLSDEISSLVEADFDVSVTGFSEEQLDALLKDSEDLFPALFEEKELFPKEKKKKEKITKKTEQSKLLHTCPHCGEQFTA